MKALIVGAGLSGATAAFLLKNKGFDVEVFESRDHIAGNCFDYTEEKMTVHKYGPHSFHTNNKKIWDFINQFGEFIPYCHVVKANTNEGLIPLPFNIESANIVGSKSEEEIIDLVFKDYSEKMWGLPWDELPNTIKNRVPKIRNSTNPCYHNDTYTGMPTHGYTEIINSMLEGIPVHLNADKDSWRKYNTDLLVYTGKLDAYFQYFRGSLGYRSLKIDFKRGPRQGCFQINECNKKVEHTRTVDYSYINNVVLGNGETILTTELPCEHTEENIPFYPKNFEADRHAYKQYAQLAKHQSRVLFLGRLATYKYLDMDAAIGQVLSKVGKING
tara:strand:- start:3853 stop:4842 length:990 start_codon:yes stop_codon:yes gene_type:complete